MSDNRRIHITFEGNPELAAQFSGKKAGDVCTAEVKFQVQEIDDKGLVGVVEEISPEGYESEGGTKVEVEAAKDEPAFMISVGTKKAK